MNYNRLLFDIKKLSCVYPVALDDNFERLVVSNFNLPPGYNLNHISVLLMLPPDYPESPPGTGNSGVYLPSGLLFDGIKPIDYHENSGPDDNWAWWCYAEIKWDLCKDDLITFFELLRAHMTNPPINSPSPIYPYNDAKMHFLPPDYQYPNFQNNSPPSIYPHVNLQDNLQHLNYQPTKFNNLPNPIYRPTNLQGNLSNSNYGLTDVENSNLNFLKDFYEGDTNYE